MAAENEWKNRNATTDAVVAKRTQLRDETYADDLPRFCLEQDPAESKKTLAWVNSICCAFLLIGIVGLKARPLEIVRRQVQQEEAVATVIEPLVPAIQTISPDSTPETASEAPPEEGNVVAVVPDSALVAFSVPTVGNVVVPMNKATAPPKNPMAPVVPISGVRIERIEITGSGGSRPAPFYPRESVIRQEQGTVVLLIEVSEVGRATSVEVIQSSGFPALDRAAVDVIKRSWYFGPAQGPRKYECPIVFQLK